MEVSDDFVREECSLGDEVPEVADVRSVGREMAANVERRLRMIEDAHGGAPVLVDVRPAVDPVHVLVPVAEAQVAARYEVGGKVIGRRGRESFITIILAYAI